MNWTDYIQRFYQLSPAEQEREWSTLTPEQRAAFHAARNAAEVAPPATPRPAATSPKRSVGRVVGCILGIVTISIVGMALLVRSRVEQVAQESQEAAAPKIQVEATELVREYAANEVAADQKYRDQWLFVEGSVESIGKDLTGSLYVTLDGPADTFRNVQCFFDAEQEHRLATLTVGRYIAVRCKASGLMGNVLVKECTIVATRQ